MIPRLHKRGTSFKGACGYILHDAQKTSRDRVLWSATQNLISKADDAWFEMFATTRDQAALKEQSGHSARGRKNTNPVLHMTLSWAVGESPTPEHMRETALSSLKAMGLEAHQAVMAAHCDKDHLHLHIVVNTIHPETGITAPLKYTKERLSRWAEAYEREHGIHCEQRIINNDERRRALDQQPIHHVTAAEAMRLGQGLGNEPLKQQPRPRKPVKHRSPHRQRHIAKADVIDRMKRYRAEFDHRHMVERDETWSRHRQEFAELVTTTKQAAVVAQDYVEKKYKPHWRELYAAQRKESRSVAKDRNHIFERAVYVFVNADRLGSGKRLSLRNKIQLICSPTKLMDAVGRMHARERKGLAQIEKAETAERLDRVWAHHQPRFDALRARQSAERDAQRLAQAYRARNAISYLRARNELILERRYGRPQRTAADAPANENDQAYSARIRTEMKAIYDRNRTSDVPGKQQMPELVRAPEEAPSKAGMTFNAAASPASDQPQDRAADIKQPMAEWRKHNPDRDFGREM